MLIPTVIDKTNNGECAYDIYSRLLDDRIIFITGEINDAVANTVIAQMLYLESKSAKAPISLYINSPGGVSQSGLAILDTMNYIKCPVSTICIGLCASAAALLLAGGQKGKRFSLPNAKIMIHQPLGGAQGQASDIAIQANEILKTKKRINDILAQNTSQPLSKIEVDTDRDFYMNAEEAEKYGLVDKNLLFEKVKSKNSDTRIRLVCAADEAGRNLPNKEYNQVYGKLS